MANLAKFRKARTIVRRNGGIPKLIDLLDIDLSKVRNNAKEEKHNLSGIGALPKEAVSFAGRGGDGFLWPENRKGLLEEGSGKGGQFLAKSEGAVPINLRRGRLPGAVPRFLRGNSHGNRK